MWWSNRRVIKCSKSYFKKKLDYYNEFIKGDEIAKNNALIAFYYRINPNKLTDTQWCKKVAEMDFVLKYTGILTDK